MLKRRVFSLSGVTLLLIGFALPALNFGGVFAQQGTATATSALRLTSTPAPTATTGAQLQDDTLLHDTSLVDYVPGCVAPCWHGITPGKSLWEDAIAILEADPTLEKIEVMQSEDSYAAAADFQQSGGSPCCQLFSQDGQTVNLIFLRLAPTISLGQLIAAQGQPKYVFDSPYIPDQIVMHLIYPDKSLIIYAFIGGIDGTLSANSPIVGALYSSFTDINLMLKTSNLHAWEGYQSYQAYASSVYAVTPSTTASPP